MSDPMPDPTGELRGLSSDQVAERRAQRGFNELPTAGKSGLLSDIFALLREPMSLLLLVCGGIYAAVGDRQEAAMLLGFVIFIMALTLFQERKTGRALAALRDLASPRALVIRDGRRLRIAGRELVEDDLIVFGEGDRVPADAVVVQASHVVVDESLVSGESVPVRKSAWDGWRPVFDRSARIRDRQTRSAGRSIGWVDAGHGDPSQRVPGRRDHVFGARRLALGKT